MKRSQPHGESPKQNLMGCYVPITLLVVAMLCCTSSKYLILTVPLNLPALIVTILVTGILPPILYRIVYVGLYRISKVQSLSDAVQKLAVTLLRVIILLCPPLFYRLIFKLIRYLRNVGILSTTNIAKGLSFLASVALTISLASFIYMNFVMLYNHQNL
jgi:hypothetical protein